MAQLYIRPKYSSSVAGKRLAAYRRVHVAAGKSQVIEFSLPAATLAVLDPQNRWTVEAGAYEVMLGGSSSGEVSGTFQLTDTAKVAALSSHSR